MREKQTRKQRLADAGIGTGDKDDSGRLGLAHETELTTDGHGWTRIFIKPQEGDAWDVRTLSLGSGLP